MNISCLHCQSSTLRKNGSIYSGKQKYECLFCHKQFVENPQNKIIPEDTNKALTQISKTQEEFVEQQIRMQMLSENLQGMVLQK